jgi:hypothetical protein
VLIKHPFPFRTRSLRVKTATILGPRGPGKIALCQVSFYISSPSDLISGGDLA